MPQCHDPKAAVVPIPTATQRVGETHRPIVRCLVYTHPHIKLYCSFNNRFLAGGARDLNTIVANPEISAPTVQMAHRSRALVVHIHNFAWRRARIRGLLIPSLPEAFG